MYNLFLAFQAFAFGSILSNGDRCGGVQGYLKAHPKTRGMSSMRRAYQAPRALG